MILLSTNILVKELYTIDMSKINTVTCIKLLSEITEGRNFYNFYLL